MFYTGDMTIAELQRIVDEYLKLFPAEAAELRRLQERLDVDEIFNNRKSFEGHGTGGAIVLSPDKKKMLLIHHGILHKWLQPGGHWEPHEPNPWTVARRKAEEETGVQIATLVPVDADRPHVPISISSHDMPADEKRHEPAHVHHDFRYVFWAASEELDPKHDAVLAAEWVPIATNDPRLAEQQAAIRKMRALHII